MIRKAQIYCACDSGVSAGRQRRFILILNYLLAAWFPAVGAVLHR